MKGSKVAEILGLLDTREWHRFMDYLGCGYFQRNDELLPLAGMFAPGLELPATRELAWQELFPDRAYDDLRLRHLMADLHRHAESYMALEAFRKEDGLRQYMLQRGLRQRNADKIYTYSYDKFRRRSGKRRRMDSDPMLTDLLTSMEFNAWQEQAGNRVQAAGSSQVMEKLDSYFLYTKLKLSCAILNNRNVLEMNAPNPLLEEVLALIRNHRFEGYPEIDIYYQIYQMLSSPDEEAPYRELRTELEAKAVSFPAKEARDMYAFAMNHCIRRINQGRAEYLQEIFDLYQEALERAFLLENGHLSPWDFKNMVVVALRLGEYGWAESFIEEYSEKLPHAFQENAYTFNKARLHFSQGEYSKVLQLLRQVEYEDVFYNLDSKVMLLKVYFELSEFEALDNLMETFRTYLRRNKLISGHHRKNYLNLIRFTRKLSKTRPQDERALAKIREELEGATNIADANWLRDKIQLLEEGG